MADKYLNKAGAQKVIGYVMNEINKKQDKSDGKTLSQNDFTDNLKSKLNNIEEAAQVNKLENVAVNGVVQSKTNKQVDIIVPTKITDLENDSDFATNEDIENLESISDLHTHIHRQYMMNRTGKVYQTKLWHYASNNTSAGEKLLDNAGLVCQPSTDTTVGRDDYAEIPLFKWNNCNYVRDDNGFARVTYIEGMLGYQTTGSVDVGVLVMTPFYKYEDCGEYDLVSVSDTPYPGYETLDASYMEDGTVCAYTIFSKYVSGVASDGKLRSQPNLHPEDFMSYTTLATEYPKKGRGYHGCTMSKHIYTWLMLFIKYGTKNSQNIFKGTTNYNFTYKPSVKLAGPNDYFVVTNDQAANVLVGSTVRLGYYMNATTHDRNDANADDIARRAIVTGKEAYDANNTKIYVDCAKFSTEDATKNGTVVEAAMASFHWISGTTDKVIGHYDGSPVSNTDSKHPYRIQGMEFNVGGYIVLSDTVFLTHANGTRDVLHKPRNVAFTTNESTIRSTYQLVGTIPASTTGNVYDDSWLGDIKITNGAWYPDALGGSDATGIGDRLYRGGDSDNQLKEFVTCGYLFLGSNAGLGILSSGYVLSSRFWCFLSSD